MRCLRCGRILKSKKSIELGYGETCYKKMFGDKKKPIKRPAYKTLFDFEEKNE